MKTNKYYVLFFLFGILYLAITSFTLQEGNSNHPNKKLIKFSHKYHLSDDVGAECGDCHSKVSESTALSDSLLPTMDDCATCHDVEDDEQCSTCHYEDVYESLIQSKTDLYFNHKFHIADQKQECTTCHQGLGKVNYSFESKELLPTMDKCYTCHNNESQASNACENCHISTVALIPSNHKEVDFFKNHKFIATDDNQNCVMCHDNSFCETCHVSTNRIVEKNTEKDFYTPYSPHNFISNAKQQQLSRVHDMNYVYTHGIDAKGKTKECLTCHQEETFCVTCHNSEGGDFALGGVIPLSHKVPNFTTIGVGTGGGEHAVLAQRDIESCAACHDTQGGDPTCITCHTDPDGIKGTNPKTHETGFMHDVEGEWHSSQGAVCFNCHTDANAHPDGVPGLGFCGYCHNSK